MLKRHSQFLKSLLFCIDLGLICACWVGAYYLRFSEIVEPATKGIPPLRIYLLLLVPIIRTVSLGAMPSSSPCWSRHSTLSV